MILELNVTQVVILIESPSELRSIVYKALQTLSDDLFIVGDDVIRGLPASSDQLCQSKEANTAAWDARDDSVYQAIWFGAIEEYRAKRVVAQFFLSWKTAPCPMLRCGIANPTILPPRKDLDHDHN